MKASKLILTTLICTFLFTYGYSQSSRMASQELNLDNFHSIGLSIAAKVHLRKGNTQSVKIEASQKVLDNIKNEVKKGSWNIEFKEKMNNYGAVHIYVTIPTIKALAIGGSGAVIGETPFDNLDNLSIAIGGSGEVSLAGSSNSLKISIGGSGDVYMEDFETNDCSVSIGGSGDCRVHVRDNLKASIAGSGDVRYKGNPKVKSSVVGSGDIRAMK